VLRFYFAESESLRGTQLLFRAEGESDYRTMPDFFPPVKPIDTTEADNWYEPGGPGPQPTPDYDKWYAELRETAKKAEKISGQVSLATGGMPTGALAGRIVYTYGGHGRTWRGNLTTPVWDWQRGLVNSMVEDLGNIDATEYFIPYLLNAGATVVPFPSGRLPEQRGHRRQPGGGDDGSMVQQLEHALLRERNALHLRHLHGDRDGDRHVYTEHPRRGVLPRLYMGELRLGPRTPASSTASARRAASRWFA
jgi:hypothetical protein